ncbi:PDR/VanB family oxidoreductase [Sphingopyxis sp.]|uniref:PDR/VanB family oxidoreductase n=1 Tax=Sphingopyxis sp. TaxID=1908224 RepID=UPI002D769D77|nr:PDR/VanB family oxidoreductase [Sphingopyxis sp.]HET6523089.1 PDR/VanB family oxidoreductase [Sphingopyxis sp.]
MTSAQRKANLLHATVKCTVDAVIQAGRDIRFFRFRPLDGESLPPSDPGAHIGLLLPNGIVRQYSLMEPDMAPDSYMIGVKRNPDGGGGSEWIHTELNSGDVIEIELPRNNFPMEEASAKNVLIAGGIGITPIYAMAKAMHLQGRPFTLHYSCRSRDDAVLLEELAAFGDVRLHFDEERGGEFLSIDKIVQASDLDTHLYCCGPGPMLGAFEAACKDRPRSHVHLEYFQAKEAAARDGGFEIELARSGDVYWVEEGSTILDTLIQADVDVPYSCEEGICGACEAKVLGGEPDHRDSYLSDEDRASGAMVLICCSGSKSPRLILDL